MPGSWIPENYSQSVEKPPLFKKKTPSYNPPMSSISSRIGHWKFPSITILPKLIGMVWQLRFSNDFCLQHAPCSTLLFILCWTFSQINWRIQLFEAEIPPGKCEGLHRLVTRTGNNPLFCYLSYLLFFKTFYNTLDTFLLIEPHPYSNSINQPAQAKWP